MMLSMLRISISDIFVWSKERKNYENYFSLFRFSALDLRANFNWSLYSMHLHLCLTISEWRIFSFVTGNKKICVFFRNEFLNFRYATESSAPLKLKRFERFLLEFQFFSDFNEFMRIFLINKTSNDQSCAFFGVELRETQLNNNF